MVIVRNLVLSVAFLFVSSTQAQQALDPPYLNDFETHLIRGLAQRQQAQMEYDRLAMEKASEELTRSVARMALEIHTAGQSSIFELGKQLAAWGEVGRGPGDFGGRGGPGEPGGPPAGPGGPGGPGGPPAAPGGPQGTRGPPGGFNTPPGGSFADALQQATGGEFDRLYLLLTILQNEEMQRAIALHIESAESGRVNPELLAWSRAHVETYRSLARKVQKAARGEDESVDNPLNREGGAVGPEQRPPEGG